MLKIVLSEDGNERQLAEISPNTLSGVPRSGDWLTIFKETYIVRYVIFNYNPPEHIKICVGKYGER